MNEPRAERLDVAKLERGLFFDEVPGRTLKLGEMRWDAITDAAFNARYEVAAGLAQKVWSDGVRDVRLVSYLLYGYYLHKRIAGLTWVFGQLTEALTCEWQGLGPEEKLRNADEVLTWLFQKIARQLLDHEKLKDEEYRRWTTEEGANDFAAAALAAAPLLAVLESMFANKKCLHRLQSLEKFLRQHERRLRAAIKVPAQPAIVVASPPAEEASASSVSPSTLTLSITVETASPFGLLVRKINLFEQLVVKGELHKAAVVARDIDQLVQRFDPLVFLPTIFMPFFRVMTKNMQALTTAMTQLESAQFKSLVQLYHVDLDAFADA